MWREFLGGMSEAPGDGKRDGGGDYESLALGAQQPEGGTLNPAGFASFRRDAPPDFTPEVWR